MKQLLGPIHYYSGGDWMYDEFEMLYYSVSYVNPKLKLKCKEQVENDFDEQISIYIYIYI